MSLLAARCEGYCVRLATFPTLDRAISYYKRTAKPRSDKESRMQDTRELRELGFRLMAQPQRGTAAIRHANRYRDGLAIAMLTAMPLRISNLGALAPGQGIQRIGDRYSITSSQQEP